MCTCDGAPSDFQREIIVRGRYDYPCIECKNLIPKGTQHWYIVWKPNGSERHEKPNEVRICCSCRQDWESLLEATGEDCYCYGFIRDEIDDAIGDYLREDDHLVQTWFPKRFLPHRLTESDGQSLLPL